jgi:DNA-binding NtrC family response regulator
MNILFVDDEKDPVWYGLNLSEVHIAKTFRQARELLEKNTYDIIYLDHDIRSTKVDGTDVIKLCVKLNKLPKKIVCISWNHAGINRIKWSCKDYNIPYEYSDVINSIPIIDGQSG